MLSDTQMQKIAGFDADIFAALRNSLMLGSEAISSAGALSVSIELSELTVSGTVAYTLAAPTVAKQRKTIRCVSAASTPLGTVTITSPDDTAGFVCASAFTFTAVGQEIKLEATTSLKWRCVGVKRAGARTVVIGTDVLTGINLQTAYLLSVTGTVSSTTTRGLPNGSCVGERCALINSVAASIPVGDISGTFVSQLGAAATSIGAIGVAATASADGDSALLEWNGSAWQVIRQNGVTLA